MAKSLAESDIVPILYQGKLGNCIVALGVPIGWACQLFR